jgi:hypothetical protein
MRRTTLQLLDDVLEAIRNIEEDTADISFDDFVADRRRRDAVIRNFEVIGEAIKNLPSDLREQNRKTDWKKISGFRDVLTHVYYGIKPSILWDNSKNNLPGLKTEIATILRNEKRREKESQK